MSCKHCASTKDKLRRIAEILNEPDQVVRGRRAHSPLDIPTDYGRVIAVSAATAGVTLAELSKELGYGKDYVKRVCTGEFKVTRRFALQAGPRLGINLELHVGRGGEAKGAPPVTVDLDKLPLRPAESLQFQPGADVAVAQQHPQLPLDGEPRIA
jgi:ribosome-binding protein aMBF1 (putative translation factor)